MGIPVREADHVIVGTGSAGSPLIRRLLDAGRTVLALEAGGRDDAAALRDPGQMVALRGTAVDHALQTVPQPGLDGRSVPWPRGRVLGGSSAINGMVHIRGHRADYDAWAYGGADGWAYRDVLPYFRRLENVDGDIDPLYRGTDGPLPARFATDPHPVDAAQLEAAQQAGVPFNPDHNGADIYGVGRAQLNIVDGRRVSAWDAYVRPVLSDPALVVLTDALVTRVLVEAGRAVGVEYRHRGETRIARSGGDVILAAGAVASPQLLQLSGIGPADELRRLGVPVVVDLAGVGANLHDHILAEVVWASRRPIDPAAHPPLEVQLFADSRPGLIGPDLQPVTGLAAYPLPGYELPYGAVYAWFPGVVRPRSRGTLRLRDADPASKPLLDPGYLRERADLDALVAAIGLTREIGRQHALDDWNDGELAPGPDVRTKAELEAYARLALDTYYHPVGTTKIGVDAASVVDPRLRVYGLEGLRVADAGVFPEVPAGNTHVPAVMVGERAADFILGTEPRA
ncbi:MAG: GMC family oxidoreductase N-terminal domain-containing protein [Microbacterium sp.]